jgi:hypothetical protein
VIKLYEVNSKTTNHLSAFGSVFLLGFHINWTLLRRHIIHLIPFGSSFQALGGPLGVSMSQGSHHFPSSCSTFQTGYLRDRLFQQHSSWSAHHQTLCEALRWWESQTTVYVWDVIREKWQMYLGQGGEKSSSLAGPGLHEFASWNCPQCPADYWLLHGSHGAIPLVCMANKMHVSFAWPLCQFKICPLSIHVLMIVISITQDHFGFCPYLFPNSQSFLPLFPMEKLC